MSTISGSIRDSRRLPGLNLIWDRAGAVLDVSLDDVEADRLVEAWQRHARRMLEVVGWTDQDLRVRRFSGGASLVIGAPIDGLYPATEVNEWAWAAAEAEVRGAPIPVVEDAAQRLREAVAAARNPALLALQSAAASHGVDFLFDDEQVSIGSGTGSLTWPTGELPAPESIAWPQVHNIPVALITGCNGKTTTTRLLNAMAEAAGMVTGMSCTDGIRIAGEAIEAGDYAGPGGARRVLWDRRVQLAALETARGGILRRGLAVRRADAAIVTNIADDHLGEFGIHDLPALTATKLVVSRPLGTEGTLVLNAEDPALVSGASNVRARIIWFSLDPDNGVVRRHLASGGRAAVPGDGALVLCEGSQRQVIERIDQIPFTLEGLARHNVANALGALALAWAMGVPLPHAARALRGFRSTSEDNPGRLNLFDLGGVRVIVDFAHNPHGMTALVDMAAALPARRKLVLIGQAGDRDDDAIRAIARIAWRARPDRVVVKEMLEYIRGRRPGEIPALLEGELHRLGAGRGTVDRAPSELDGVHQALQWARPGDLLLLTIHGQRDSVLELLDRLQAQGWKPGRPSR